MADPPFHRQRVDLLLFADGKPSRVDSAEADVMLDYWHTLGVALNDDHFTVSLDQKSCSPPSNTHA
jgi:hypothetical protein